MNAIHPTIKSTFKYSKTSIDFLDTSIHIGQGGKQFSKVYTKATDTFPLLDFKSNNPVETKLSIIYSQARRYRLLTTYDVDLTRSLSRLKLILPAQGYPNRIINTKFTEATTLSQMELLSTHSHNNKNNPPQLPFVIPYHWENRRINKIIDRNWYLIECDLQIQLIFRTKHFLSYNRNSNIHDHLVHIRFSTQGKKDLKRQVLASEVTTPSATEIKTLMTRRQVQNNPTVKIPTLLSNTKPIGEDTQHIPAQQRVSLTALHEK